MSKINLKKFNKLREQKLIGMQKHPEADLLIWNYTHAAQFKREWTSETLMARGLITDLEGNILYRPFPKFFNYEEHMGEDSKLDPLPKEPFEVFEKWDGSLGILYFDQFGKINIATRGSFVSEQAQKATKILREKYGDIPFSPSGTYLFEIIYPENRIVVDYGDQEDLVLLAARTKDGKEFDYNLLRAFAKTHKIPVVKRYRFKNLMSVRRVKEKENSEGFVILLLKEMDRLKFYEDVIKERIKNL